MRSKLVQDLIGINRKYSTLFDSPNAKSDRAFYRSMENYHKIITQCMDGRPNFAKATQAPLGVFQSFRNLGGAFDLQWEKFDQAIFRSYKYHLEEERKGSMILLNYHFSRGDVHRGCAGFCYDTDAAIRSMVALKEQFERVYGDCTEAIIPILVGFETDENALIFHGDVGEPLNLANVQIQDEEELKLYLMSELRKIFPKRPKGALKDMRHMAMKNIECINETRLANRPILDLNHKEWILALGRGLDWFYEPNAALIIGMYSDEPEEPIKKAAGIIEENMNKGRILKKDGFVLLASAAYGVENGSTFTRAKERASGYRELATRIIKANYPDIFEYMHPVTAVTNLDNRLFQIIE
ncbi:hypothetical protein HGA34_05915 [Candidatus Falkowbacteria bacterium]|nr:hypothetical protein [Candidatus Falkowbacteria bacterium]